MSDFNGSYIEKIISKVKIYLAIIAILCVILCIYDIRWIVPSIILMAIIIIYTLLENSKKKNELVNHIEEITMDVSSAGKSTLVNSPIPLILIETDGNIIWRSKKFTEVFAGADMNTYLNPIVKEMKLDIINNQNPELERQFSIDGRTYKIYGSVSKSRKRDKRKQKEYVLILYFIDDTENINLLNKYNDQTTCVGVINIDSYEEILQRALPEEKIEILSKIEKTIMDWAAETGGLIIKNDSNTFVYVFEQQYLKKIEKEKFNILDKVKNIYTEMKFAITLSISISTEGKTNYDKYKNAIAGMEIVLGRGGDQAVVKKDGKYKFYGGKTLETEKRTRVKPRNISRSISEAITNSSNVIIMGHRNIDIDAMGSALGMYRVTKTLGKECYIVTEPQGDTLGKFIDELNKITEYKESIVTEEEAIKLISKDTLLIIVDTHKNNYVEFPTILNAVEKKVIIDHHRKSPEFIENTVVSFHEVYASSTAELVTEIIQYSAEDVKLNLIEAESLYGGIMVDTKNFTFKTGVRTFEAAAYLRKFGVDIIKVKKWFQADLESYNEIAEIVKNAEIIEENIALSICTKEDENTNLICAKAADELLTISNITASFVMGKMGEKIVISGRSIGDINVQIILEKLGGGGHITLAGAQLEGFTLEEAHDELVIRINEYLVEIQ